MISNQVTKPGGRIPHKAADMTTFRINGHAVNTLISILVDKRVTRFPVLRQLPDDPALNELYPHDPKETGRNPDRIFSVKLSDAAVSSIREVLAEQLMWIDEHKDEPLPAGAPSFVAAMASSHERKIRTLAAAFGLPSCQDQ